MKIILASSEVVPFAKTGGLADVCGALPNELEKLGHQVSIFMPGYNCVTRVGTPIETLPVKLELPIGGQIVEVQIGKTKLPGSNVDVYFVLHNDYFHRDGLYSGPHGDYEDNLQRFVLFS